MEHSKMVGDLDRMMISKRIIENKEKYLKSIGLMRELATECMEMQFAGKEILNGLSLKTIEKEYKGDINEWSLKKYVPFLNEIDPLFKSAVFLLGVHYRHWFFRDADAFKSINNMFITNCNIIIKKMPWWNIRKYSLKRKLSKMYELCQECGNFIFEYK